MSFWRYTGYYGIDDNSPDRLRANARLAGVEDRLRVQVGDGALSVAAMDHLRSADIPTALAETARVLKPGGEFLFVTINSDVWVKLAFPMANHGGSYWSWKGNERLWRERMTRAGFEIVEVGTWPAEMYVLAKKRPLVAAR